MPAGPYTLVSADAPTGATVDLDGFFIDRFEVSNADYLDFVRAGGYADRALWTHPVVRDGEDVAWEDAAPLFRDRTQLPGPRGWTGQQFPEAKGRHPVTK